MRSARSLEVIALSSGQACSDWLARFSGHPFEGLAPCSFWILLVTEACCLVSRRGIRHQCGHLRRRIYVPCPRQGACGSHMWSRAAFLSPAESQGSLQERLGQTTSCTAAALGYRLPADRSLSRAGDTVMPACNVSYMSVPWLQLATSDAFPPVALAWYATEAVPLPSQTHSRK